MANYTVEQACKMIDDCFTPEYLMMEKAIERQRYVDIFTEMHNYISENIIELPFDAEVFTEEETKSKSVWDTNDKGWDGFWRNVGKVLRNIWNKFWGFIKAIVTLSDEVKPQEAKKIADNAEAVAKDLEQKSEQEVQQKVQKAVEEKPEEVKAVAQNVKAATVSIFDGIAKIQEIVDKREKNKTQANKDFAGDKLKSELKSISSGALHEMEELLKSMMIDLDKIISNPSEFRADRGGLLQFLQVVKDNIEPEKVDDMNKVKNYLRSLIINRLYWVKYFYDLITVYPNQSDTIKTTIISHLGNLAPDIINKLSTAIDDTRDFEAKKLASTANLVSGFINAAVKANKNTGVKAKKASIDSAKLKKYVDYLQTAIDNRKTNIATQLSTLNITSLKAEDYIFDYDKETGQAQIKDIPQLKEAVPSEDLKQKMPNLQSDMTAIVKLVANASSLLISTKTVSDRKLFNNINTAINKLSNIV